MPDTFTSNARKKAFDKAFKEKIIPFFEGHGFKRQTKTSKRLSRWLGNGLSVFLFFEFKNFGSGFYDITVSYFDDDFGDVMDDAYLAMANKTFASFQGASARELEAAIDAWLIIAESNLMVYIDNHSSHKALLVSDEIYLSKYRAEERIALLKRKS